MVLLISISELLSNCHYFVIWHLETYSFICFSRSPWHCTSNSQHQLILNMNHPCIIVQIRPIILDIVNIVLQVYLGVFPINSKINNYKIPYLLHCHLNLLIKLQWNHHLIIQHGNTANNMLFQKKKYFKLYLLIFQLKNIMIIKKVLKYRQNSQINL
jgi:hypothetical protein